MGCRASGLWGLRVSCFSLRTSALPSVLLSEASQDSPLLSPVGKRAAGSEPQLNLLTVKRSGDPGACWGWREARPPAYNPIMDERSIAPRESEKQGLPCPVVWRARLPN